MFNYSPKVTEQCCIAATNLSANNVNNSYNLGAAGLCNLLAVALSTHMDSESIVEEALAAVASLTSLGKTSKNHPKFHASGNNHHLIISQRRFVRL